MKWTAEADLVVGLAVGSGKRKVGVGLGIGRRKTVKSIGVDLGEHRLKRCCVFFLKNSAVSSLNWSLAMRNSVLLDRDKAMKRANVFNLLLQMMPSSHHPVAPASPDHWAFLDEVDAPRWVDLVKEAALLGTIGDDPWFHRCHSHHETSLARGERLVTASDSSGSSVEIPIRDQQPTTRRLAEKGGGAVSKLVKPAFKATVMKACLGGGLQRISGGGSIARGRLSSSSRPRLSPGLAKSRSGKKVNVIHRSSGRFLQQQMKRVGFDARAAQSEPTSVVGTPKKPSDAKPNSLRSSAPLFNNVREAAVQKIIGRRGAAADLRSASRPVDDTAPKGFESPASSRLYALSTPPGHRAGENISESNSVGAKSSSPSDMYLSSDASSRQSNSSQESVVRALSAAATASARRRILAVGRKSIEGGTTDSPRGRSNDSWEIPSADLSQTKEVTAVRVDEPHSEITSFNAREIAVDDTEATTGGGQDWDDHPELYPTVRKRRSLGPAKRVKVAENGGSPSVQKKSSARDNSNQVAGEKSGGSQATHPILEKLRKSWGSALRVKQREDAETAFSDSRSDTSAENSAEVKVGSNVPARKKWDQTQVQLEVMKGAHQAGAGAMTNDNQSSSETGVLIRSIVTHERRAAIRLEHQLLQQPAPHLHLITDDGLLVSPRKLHPGINHDADNRRGDKSHDTTAETKTVAAKVGLAKIQANHQRSKPDVPSKFKKQYVHGDMGMSKSLCMQRSNKENVQMEVKVPSPPRTGFAWKRKPAVPTRKQLSPQARHHHPAATAAGAPNVPPRAALRTASTQTSPPPRHLAATARSGGLLSASATKTVSLDAADVAGPKLKASESLDRKGNSLAVLRGYSSASSVPKLTKQKSEKISSATWASAKTSKTNAKIADESALGSSEDRKSRALKYEPRIHSVKAIKEWEGKTGKRYYDLTPIERKKVNQEISAAAAAATAKARETKKSAA